MDQSVMNSSLMNVEFLTTRETEVEDVQFLAKSFILYKIGSVFKFFLSFSNFKFCKVLLFFKMFHVFLREPVPKV